MKRLTLFLATLMMSVPAAAAGPSLDGYTFEKAQFEHDNIKVEFVKVHTQAEMVWLAGTFGIKPTSGAVKAFSVNEGDTCVIYAEDPKVDYEPEFLGHELAHCIFGNFHPQQSKKYQ